MYVTYAPTYLSNVADGQSSHTFWASGIGGGVTFNLQSGRVVSLGLDARGSTTPGYPGADTVMGGLKLGFHPPETRLKPYLQFTAGYLRPHRQYPVAGLLSGGNYAEYGTLGILSGLDLPPLHHVDVRAIEIGVSKGWALDWDASMVTVNTGLVVHF
jgi:hypothetical protein